MDLSAKCDFGEVKSVAMWSKSAYSPVKPQK